jgi:hypothetical protein
MPVLLGEFGIRGFNARLVVHAMEGFNYDKAREVCAIPDDYSIEAMIAMENKD